jgi:uncharacterized membrane protein
MDRSLVKTITFRLVIVFADMLIVFAITHRYDITFGYVVLTNIFKGIIYFFHERAWDKVDWGRYYK